MTSLQFFAHGLQQFIVCFFNEHKQKTFPIAFRKAELIALFFFFLKKKKQNENQKYENKMKLFE